MRTLTNVTVGRAALHIVSPREGLLTLTQGLLDLADGVDGFLADHVERGLGDPKAAAADFVGTGEHHAGPISRAILSGRSSLLDGSQALARLLYGATEHDERVSDGTLAVLACTANEGQEFLAILKLDPNDQYSAIITQDDAGNDVVQLIVRSDILPSVRERVQKSAFIRPDGAEYAMLLVDRQRRGGTVSDFFVRDFLRAELTLDAPARTHKLYSSLKHAQNEVAGKLEPDQLRRLNQYVDGIVSGTNVRVDDVVDGLPIPEELHGAFSDRLDQDLPDRDFVLDDSTVNRLMRRRTYTGDNGLTVGVRADAWDDMVDEYHDDEKDEWVIQIRTKQWQRQ